VSTRSPFSALSPLERATALLDPGTLTTLDGDEQQLATLWLGRGRIDGRAVLLALTNGHVRGGTIGVEEARAFSRLAAAAERSGEAIVVGWDTGGVRVHEGPAALAAASAVGVALTRLALLRSRVIAVLSAPRGCFGAPSVIAATASATIVTANAHWGLTGPKLLVRDGAAVSDAAGRAATSARHRSRAGHADTLVPDSARRVREAVAAALRARPRRGSARRILDDAVLRLEALMAQLPARHGTGSGKGDHRQRDFFHYSLHGRWRPTGPVLRGGHVHAAWGLLDDRPAVGIIVGPERSQEGIGIADAYAVARILRHAMARTRGAPAPILTFLFCRGHANDVREERAGLPCALAECLRGLVVARLAGHPILCVLGGGAYGAAYLSFAAPSHRVLAIRGTSVAPMAPRVLAAFQRLRGMREAADTPQDLATHIPEIRIVDSIVRLPAALGEELQAARAEAHRLIPPAGFCRVRVRDSCS
jgi:Malonate decarboxylase gamma subunit/Carboxyl transferase domain